MVSRSATFLFMLVFLAALCVPFVRADTLPLDGRVIILDAGHGAQTTNTYERYDEQVTMLKLAQKIKLILESHGATVYMTRTESDTVPLPIRVAMINIWSLEALRASRVRELAWNTDTAEDIAEIDRLMEIMQSIIDDPEENAGVYMNSPFTPERSIHPELGNVFRLQDDPEIANRFLVISLHSNATARPINTSVNGASVFHISSKHKNTPKYYTEYSYEEQSRRFGEVLLDAIETTGISKRGVTYENFFMIREHNIPGVLAENGFHTNARDRANLQDDSFLDRLAEAYLDAISHYFDELPLPADHPTLQFSDVRYGAWHFDAVSHVYQQGLLVGTGAGKFSPDAGMTRAMLTIVLARLVDADTSIYAEAPYSDVSIDAWYGKAVAWAADNGISAYIEDSVFRPDQYATREEAAHMIYNYFHRSSLTLPSQSDMVFEDDGDISSWAKGAVTAIAGYGVIRGDDLNRFNPHKTITRAEISQILFNIFILLSDT